MKRARYFPNLLLAVAFLCAPALRAQDAPEPTRDLPRVTESERRLGMFTIGAQAYSVVTRDQTISGAAKTKSESTVSELEIRDANQTAVYQESFSTALAGEHFISKLAVSASLLDGAGGRALVLRFLEDSGTPAGAAESWEMFGLVNGKLTRFAAPLPLGQGGAAVNGVLTGVMLRGGIGVVPLASTAEPIEFRVWAGNFFISVPVRMDWPNGQWSEAEQCFANATGSLRPVGCNLRITAVRRPAADGRTITLYAQPEENAYNARQVPVRGNSAIEFPAVRALVKWKNSGDRFTAGFDDLWLRVRIDGNEGWVHSATDLASLGLPASAPPQ